MVISSLHELKTVENSSPGPLDALYCWQVNFTKPHRHWASSAIADYSAPLQRPPTNTVPRTCTGHARAKSGHVHSTPPRSPVWWKAGPPSLLPISSKPIGLYFEILHWISPENQPPWPRDRDRHRDPLDSRLSSWISTISSERSIPPLTASLLRLVTCRPWRAFGSLRDQHQSCSSEFF